MRESCSRFSPRKARVKTETWSLGKWSRVGSFTKRELVLLPLMRTSAIVHDKLNIFFTISFSFIFTLACAPNSETSVLQNRNVETDMRLPPTRRSSVVGRRVYLQQDFVSSRSSGDVSRLRVNGVDTTAGGGAGINSVGTLFKSARVLESS